MKKKSKTKDEKQWLNKMSEFGCCICKRYHDVIDAPPANIHHIREGMGMGQKNNHFMVLPLCHHHHQSGPAGKAFHASPKKWVEAYGKESEMLEWVLDNL
jgi:hypothetical protein